MASQSDPKKRHEERNDQDEGRAGDRKRWQAYGLRVDDGMKSIEQKWITNRRGSGNQSQIVKALLKKPSAILRANECFHHKPIKPEQRRPVYETTSKTGLKTCLCVLPCGRESILHCFD